LKRHGGYACEIHDDSSTAGAAVQETIHEQASEEIYPFLFNNFFQRRSKRKETMNPPVKPGAVPREIVYEEKRNVSLVGCV